MRLEICKLHGVRNKFDALDVLFSGRTLGSGRAIDHGREVCADSFRNLLGHRNGNGTGGGGLGQREASKGIGIALGFDFAKHAMHGGVYGGTDGIT